MSIKGLCKTILKKDYGIDAVIKSITLLEQEEIDRTMNLKVIEFRFTDSRGGEGDAMAFLDEDSMGLEVVKCLV